MQRGLLFLILGAGIVAAVLATLVIGGKQAPAPAVVELAMPPHAEPPAPPQPGVIASEIALAPDAQTAAVAVASPTREALTSATPVADQPTGGAATPSERAASAADPQINGGLPMVVTRGSNMRAEPSVNAPLVAHYKPGERVYRMEEKAVLGYYLVRSDKATGWIWWMNVAADEQPPANP